MATDSTCPVCDADLLFGGDECRGDTVICSYCGAPFVVKSVGTPAEDWELEEDF